MIQLTYKREPPPAHETTHPKMNGSTMQIKRHPGRRQLCPDYRESTQVGLQFLDEGHRTDSRNILSRDPFQISSFILAH